MKNSRKNSWYDGCVAGYEISIEFIDEEIMKQLESIDYVSGQQVINILNDIKFRIQNEIKDISA